MSLNKILIDSFEATWQFKENVQGKIFIRHIDIFSHSRSSRKRWLEEKKQSSTTCILSIHRGAVKINKYFDFYGKNEKIKKQCIITIVLKLSTYSFLFTVCVLNIAIEYVHSLRETERKKARQHSQEGWPCWNPFSSNLFLEFWTCMHTCLACF